MGGGAGAGWIGPASPELLASVEALPPIRDRSNVVVDEQVADRGGLHFRTFIARWRRELLLGLCLVLLYGIA
jgi:ATP-binding cassette subfamily B protein